MLQSLDGFVLPNPSRAAFIGGVSSGKTCCILNTVAARLREQSVL